ncbi:MAG TPA: hypothetical protein VFR43_00440 [Gaiellaceae bacterium]|nr:hypothetical protein [Gaiellaceae bacterium]
MAGLAERYLTLGLRLGRHVDGLVDSYCGPPELAAAVEAEDVVEPAALADEADALAAELAGAEDLEPQRRGWLADQVRALGTYARVLAGEELSYADEVEGCYGVRPERGSDDAYRAAHERLAELVPGDGPLRDRLEARRREQAVPAERLVPAFEDLVAVLRDRTAQLVELPAGEELVAEAVRDEPWWAFNYYLGDLRSRVVLNVDVVTTAFELVALAVHEAYPGHHTEHAVKEERLIRQLGRVEESIQLVPTPQALVSEGIAETGTDLLLDDDLERALSDVLRSHGLDHELGRAIEVDRAREPLRRASVDAALLLHEEGGSPAEAQAYLERWSLSSPERAAHSVQFLLDRTWRAYVITYSAGRDLCRAYVDGDAARFRTLLTEQVRVGDLAAAAASP